MNMQRYWIWVNGILCALLLTGVIGCNRQVQSSFVQESIKPVELANVKYRVLKTRAVGRDTGLKLVWIPFVSPTEGAAKLDLLSGLEKEGIQIAGRNIGFTNATYVREGTGLFGFVGWPTIKLVADVIEIQE